MNVISFFDGISTARLALQLLGVKVNKYFASEIDKNAIKVSRANFNDVIQLGDIRNIIYRNNKIIGDCAYATESIDLLVGGSPCTNFSFAGKRNGMITKDKVDVLTLEQYMDMKKSNFIFEGQSYLFWEYVRLLKDIKPKYFLLENVKMADKWKQIITDTLGVEPIEINSSLVSAQNRVRLYWTNIPNISQPEDLNIKLSDILEDISFIHPAAIRGRQLNKATIIGRRLDDAGHRKDNDKNIPITQCLEVRATNTDKSNCLTTVSKDNVLTPLSVGRYPNAFKDKLPFRYYTRTECERLQTLPDGYTKAVSEEVAKKLIGNGWTTSVIVHIFNHIPDKDLI